MTEETPPDELITAIAEDGAAYPVGKLEAHRRDLPHLAISVFVFHGDRLLLQRRAIGKYHSGGLWANTCCSHPRWGETPEACAHRRLREELGLALPLTQFGVVRYAARVGDLFENEIAHCFHGIVDGAEPVVAFNPDEVMAIEWHALSEVLCDVERNGARYAEWFRIYMTRHRDMFVEQLPDSARSGPG